MRKWEGGREEREKDKGKRGGREEEKGRGRE